MAVTHRLLWKRNADTGMRWYIRGIHDDGRLYGDIKYQSDDPAERKACSIEATLTADDLSIFQSLVKTLPFDHQLPSDAFAFIVVVDAERNDQGLFPFNPGDEHETDSAATFLRIRDLIQPYLESEWKRYW